MLKKVFTEELLKNKLRAVIILGVIVASYGIISATNTYKNSISPDQYRTFTVQGEGKVETKPDIATFSISVVTEGTTSDLAATQSKNAEDNNAVISFAKEQGIAEADIKTTNYSIEPRYEYPNCTFYTVCPGPKLVGYTVRNTISLKIRDFIKISAITSGVVDRGVNSFSGPDFSIDEPEDFKAQARELAITKAKEKAESIARASGIKVGKIIAISESTGYYPVSNYRTMKAYGAADEAAVSPSMEAGSQEVTATVNITFEIK